MNKVTNLKKRSSLF